ncbi:MAG: hypothetical protein ACI39E_07650 [Acutalibacteraceae bacterium]
MSRKRQILSEEKIEKDIRRSKTIGWIAIIIFGLALLFLVGSVAVTSWQYERRHTFDSEAWMTGGERVHGEMLESLLEQYELVGMSREEVMSLLGGGIKNSPFASDDTFVYRIKDGYDTLYMVLTLSGETVTSVDIY